MDKLYGIGRIGDWGLWDTKEHCWYGNKEGAITYPERQHAQLSAAVLNERFGWKGKIRVKLFTQECKTFKDELTPNKSFEEALNDIESRAK